MSAFEAIYEAFSRILPDRVPSGSAGDLCGVQYWGHDETRDEMMFGGGSLPVGQGANPRDDGATLFVGPLAQSKLASVELMETKCPLVRYERWEFLVDSAGPGKFRGGMGWELHWRCLKPGELISVIERTKAPSWGQQGGLAGTPNRLILSYPDGRNVETRKVTALPVPAGTLVQIRCGGGGGYGSPLERSPDAVHDDLRLGLVSEARARQHYPHAFA